MEKPNSGKEDEGSDQRNRHGQQRNQRGAPALQEEKNNNDDQDERDQKSFNDLLDALRHGKRRVERNDEIHILRESAAFICAINFLTPAAASTAFDPGN